MSLKDWKIDEFTHDLVIDDTTNYDLELLEGLEYYSQKVKIKLLFFFKEWYLDQTLGVDWFGIVFVKNPNLTNVDNMLKLSVTSIEGINGLIKWQSNFDINNGLYTVDFIADTDAGDLEFNEDLSL